MGASDTVDMSKAIGNFKGTAVPPDTTGIETVKE
jgi:hypothetical protein